MKLTLQRLVELEACEEQRILFAEHFGAEVEITEGLCEKLAGVFHWDWAAGNLLIALARDEYRRAIAPAQAECDRVIAHAWAEYTRFITQAWDEYLRAIAPAWDECKRTVAPASAEYERVRASAMAEYNRVKAITFARLYNTQPLKEQP